MISLPVLTHSAMATARSCYRKYQLRYLIGLRRDREATPLRMGSAIHLGIDLRAKGKSEDDAIRGATAGYEVLPAWATTDETVGEWMLEREIVARLLSGYFWRWTTDPIEVIASEQVFELPLLNPETGKPSTTRSIAGKIDGIIKLDDGRLAVKETKTTGDAIDPDSDFWKRLRIDQQISMYMLATRRLGHAVQTVYYDVIHKPDIAPKLIPTLDADGFKIVLDATGARVFNKNNKPRESASKDDGWVLQQKRETPEQFGERLTADIAARPDTYYARREIPRLDSDLAEFEQELWDQHQILASCEKSERFPRNTAACLTMGRCEFWSICTEGINPATGTPPGYIVTNQVHPELKAEETST